MTKRILMFPCNGWESLIPRRLSEISETLRDIVFSGETDCAVLTS